MRIAKWPLLLGALLLAIAISAWAARSAKIVVEAEHFFAIQPSMSVGASQDASGGKYVYIPLKRPHGENESGPYDKGNALYKVNIPKAGVYRLWARTNWHDSCGNSFFVVVDEKDTSWIGEDGTYQKWHWVRGKTYQLSSGVHTFRFQNREDGAKLDQFLLTTDLRYVPTRAENETAAYVILPSNK
ncbi:MAG: hypothetical protein H5T86_05135 [Armatimonadetes bacterium]|nr:hypothetical protein [Armatimonadota bacterium]